MVLVLKNNESDDTLTQSQSSSEIKQKEWGGQKGPEPTRYGDWEINGTLLESQYTSIFFFFHK